MEDNTNINPGSVIMNTRSKFIMKKGSGAASGLTVSSGNHMSVPGLLMKQITDKIKDENDKFHEFDKDVVIDEDVWIASNVTLLSGVKIGRGCEVGAGSVVRKSTPPYSIIIGNPAKIVGFRFTPEEIIEHEMILYSSDKRLPLELLNNNYKRYYIDKIQEIKNFLKQ